MSELGLILAILFVPLVWDYHQQDATERSAKSTQSMFLFALFVAAIGCGIAGAA